MRGILSGFSLIEMLFYVVLLALALIAILHTLIAITRSFAVLRAAERIEQEALVSVERMVREIRDAESIDDAGSTLGAHPGVLRLYTTTAAGAERTVQFSLENGKLALEVDGVPSGFLTSDKTSISNLVFRGITTSRSEGVKIEMTFEAGTSTTERSENFYITGVLRDSY